MNVDVTPANGFVRQTAVEPKRRDEPLQHVLFAD
jgi:hypothetical protein